VNCRHCNDEVTVSFVDLATAPPSNAYVSNVELKRAEKYFPLRILVCTNCWLVQTEDYADATDLFSSDYAYFSSFSTSWLEHSKRYASDMTERLGLDQNSMVAEIAANDGYLLQYFHNAGIPCYGVEPAGSTAEAARKRGLEIVESFFGVELAVELASQNRLVDLLVANNVLAHVPDINDFVRAFRILLKTGGVATFEFPHLMRLVDEKQFDTIYHEHYSYLSLIALLSVFKQCDMEIFDVEELSTHGGSLRLYCQSNDTGIHPISESVSALASKEKQAGLTSEAYYSGFQGRAEKVKNEFLGFLLDANKRGKKVIGYGAAAKGNTLLNFAGVKPDLIPFVVDQNPAKQGKFLPGSRIPILDETWIEKEKPDYIVIFPWNLSNELKEQLKYVRAWDGQFVTAVPEMRID
jgi:SAM-dependent methyltransferase